MSFKSYSLTVERWVIQIFPGEIVSQEVRVWYLEGTNY